MKDENEYLRINNESNQSDESISRVSFKEKKKTIKAPEKNTFFNIIRNDFKESRVLADESPAPKPKLLSSLVIITVTILTLAILLVICMYTQRLIFIPILILLGSFGIPFSLLHFFYNFATRNKVSFNLVVICSFVGAMIYLVISIVDNNLNLIMENGSFVFTIIKMFIAVIALFAALLIILQIKKGYDNFSVLLLGVSLICGFNMIKIGHELFINSFSTIQAEGEPILAISTVTRYLSQTIEQYKSNYLYIALYKPLIEICAFAGLTFALNTLIQPKGPNTLNYLYLIIITLLDFMVIILVEFNNLSIIIGIIIHLLNFAVTFVLLFKIMDYCCKNENYIE